MDKKEASFILANIDRRVCDDELNEALDVAIKALEQEPCDNAVSRQDVLDLAKKGVLVSNGNYKSVCKAINEIPPVNPTEPCKDAIDRAEAVRVASGYCHPANVAKELAKLPSVNPQPCEDAISRQAVQDYVAKYLSQYLYNDVREAVEVIDEYIGELPPVNPTKTGHWIEHPEIETSTPEYLMFYECSECGDKQCFCKSDIHKKHFCNNCGAKMVEPQESEDKDV